ncbi:hypothetical protein K439DRAFT_1643382 [Ramaria rubella]|nr:hypothetical protein K439DRAFT_1643382 [Ramaria rubella]
MVRYLPKTTATVASRANNTKPGDVLTENDACTSSPWMSLQDRLWQSLDSTNKSEVVSLHRWDVLTWNLNTCLGMLANEGKDFESVFCALKPRKE